jgi:DNA polymerase-3 subunit delta'
LDESTVARLLQEKNIASSADEAARLATFSGGSLTRAAEMADPQLWVFRADLLNRLSQTPLPSTVLTQNLLKFVDEAGKDAPPRRARLRLALGFAAEFYRQLMRSLTGLPLPADAELSAAVNRAVQTSSWDAESAATAAQRCLDAITHVDRNANQSTLVEAWVDQLVALSRPLALQRLAVQR